MRPICDRNRGLSKLGIVSVLVLLNLTTFVYEARFQELTFDKHRLSSNGISSYNMLFDARMFTIGGEAWLNRLSKNETALIVLANESLAQEAFMDLARNSASAGSLYGLSGLNLINCKCFVTEASSLKKLVLNGGFAQKMDGSSGCLIGNENTTDLIDVIVAGRFDSYPVFARSKSEREKQ